MCEFCQGSFTPIETDSGEAELVQIVPLPALNLTTGKKSEQADPPYHAIYIRWIEDGEDQMFDYIPIKYCPICGRKLDEQSEEKTA